MARCYGISTGRVSVEAVVLQPGRQLLAALSGFDHRSTGRRGTLSGTGSQMNIGKFRFGSVKIDGLVYERDIVIDRGKVRKRKKKPSKKFREEYGHTPVSLAEKIPWKCQRLVVGTGRYGSLPVMEEVKREARRRKVALLILPTDEALAVLVKRSEETNAILHVTC